MRRALVLMAVTFGLLIGNVARAAEEDYETVDEMIERLAEICEPEITSYCSEVTPGEGRLLACFFAHQDKISPRCEYALYDAAAKLEDFAAAVTYLAAACDEDLDTYCSEVEMGEGRVGMCLLEHKEEVSEDCRTVMDEGGFVAFDE